MAETWLVLASHDEGGTRTEKLIDDPDSLERVAYVQVEGWKPTAEEVAWALEGYDGFEFLLLPLSAALRASATVETTVTMSVDGLNE